MPFTMNDLVIMWKTKFMYLHKHPEIIYSVLVFTFTNFTNLTGQSSLLILSQQPRVVLVHVLQLCPPHFLDK